MRNLPNHFPGPGPLARALQHLVEERLGLHYAKDREGEFLEGLERARQAMGLGDLAALFHRLDDEAPGGLAWRRVSQELTTGESFFLRDRGQMALIRDVLLEELRRRARPGEPIQLWSAGCSRGEEAYSLAILSWGVAADHPLRILGTDINASALETAREGWYSPWSLRGLEPEIRQRWFRADRDGFRIVPELRERVTFREHNLLRDPMWLLSEGQGFDLILCRNVFIYFRPRRVKETIQAFRNSLKPHGALVLGHGEWGLEAPEGMSLEAHPHSVVLRPSAPRPVPRLKPPEPPPPSPPPGNPLRPGPFRRRGPWRSVSATSVPWPMEGDGTQPWPWARWFSRTIPSRRKRITCSP